MSARSPEEDPAREAFDRERRQQIFALLILAVLVLIGSVLRAGISNVFLPGWWRLW